MMCFGVLTEVFSTCFGVLTEVNSTQSSLVVSVLDTAGDAVQPADQTSVPVTSRSCDQNVIAPPT